MYRLADLATEGRGATIAWLAENEHLPRKYLEQVVRDLKQAGLLESKPGPGGGCRLGRPADGISIGDVVRALDGEVKPGHCLEMDVEYVESDDCPGCWGLTTCALREVWVDLQQAINGTLDRVTLQDLVLRQRKLTARPIVDYQI